MLCVATCLQHRTREVRVQRDETGKALSRPNFENYTVVASALVAEFLVDAPGSNPGALTGVQVRLLPSALRDVERP